MAQRQPAPGDYLPAGSYQFKTKEELDAFLKSYFPENKEGGSAHINQEPSIMHPSLYDIELAGATYNSRGGTFDYRNMCKGPEAQGGQNMEFSNYEEEEGKFAEMKDD